MTKQLPERANLEHLKTQAKALLSSLTDGSRLADAQRELAREYGFPSWTKLKRFIESREDRLSAFFLAVRGGDRSEVERLLTEDRSLVNTHSPEDFEATPLNLAAGRNDLPLIDLLIEYGADPDGKSTWWAGGFGPLDFCSESTADHLIKRGATLTAHAAARLGRAKELREIILRNPAVVHERGGDGQYPLHFSKTPEIVDILVDAGADLDARDLDHEGTAAQFRIEEIDVLRRLIERGATPDIFMAVMLEDLPLIREFLKNDPDAFGRSAGAPGNPMIPKAPGEHIYAYNIGFLRPFQVAGHFRKAAAWEVLREFATPKDQLLMAIWEDDREGALRLKEHVSELSPEEQSMLPQCAFNRMLSRVKLMLDLGFNVDSVGVHHSSALDRAAFHGFDDVIELILQYHPSLTIRNEFGGMPINAAITGSTMSWRKDGNFIRTIELLIEAGSELPDKLYGREDVQALLKQKGVVQTS